MTRERRDSDPTRAPLGLEEEWVEPTSKEAEDASSLAAGLDRKTDGFSTMLRAALAPSEIEQDAHEAILARALGTESSDAEPTDREVRESVRLAASIEAILRRVPAPSQEEADSVAALSELARAVKLAHAPTAIDELGNERLIRRSVRAPGRALFAAIAEMTAVAAAVFGIVLSQRTPASSREFSEADFAFVRSTSELFDPASPFPREGGTSARIDRIAESRASDLRKNRFATWGIE
jgi:hypothetical protein